MIKGGPKIITDGLVFYLDAFNSKSYPGSGIIWYEMRSGYNGTITGSSYLSSSFSFNGTSDSVTLPFPISVGTNNFTMTVWCKPTNTTTLPVEAQSGFGGISNMRYLIGPGSENIAGTAGSGISVGTNGVCVIEHGPSYIPSLLTWTNTVSSELFTNITVTYTNKQPKLYVNGVWVRTGLTSAQNTVNLTLESLGREATYGWYSGYAALFCYYNRILSEDEILQNHYTVKSRFRI